MGITSNKDTFFASGSGARTAHVGPGKIFRIVASKSNASVQRVLLYDGLNTSAPILLALTVSSAIPFDLSFPSSHPLTFASGLTLNPANADVHLSIST